MERDANPPEEPSTDAPVSTGGEPEEDEGPERDDERIDEASEESFPASDPPAF